MLYLKNKPKSPLELLQMKQRGRVDNLIRHAITNSSFYRDYYAGFGITTDTLSHTFFSDLPLTDKKTVMMNFDRLVCEPTLKLEALKTFITDENNFRKKFLGTYQIIHSSGSSGFTGIYVRDEQEWKSVIDSFERYFIKKHSNEPSEKTRLGFLGPLRGHFAAISVFSNLPKNKFELLPLPITAPLEENLPKLEKFNPHYLLGSANASYILAQEQLTGRLNISPIMIIAGGEPHTIQMRKTVKDAFGHRPRNFYSASECLGLGIECEEYEKMHLCNENYYIEILDEEGKPVVPGKRGRLVMTNLTNYTQPLIRYALGDDVILSPESCPCGNPSPVLERILGRAGNMLWFERADGSRGYIHPFVFVDFYVKGLQKIQAVQTNQNSLLLKVMVEDSQVLKPVKEKMEGILREGKLLETVALCVKEVKHIADNPTSGKHELVIPWNKENPKPV